MFIRCVNPIRPGMPSEYASSSPEKIVKSAAKGRRVLPDFWISAGFGSSTYKPGCGKERPIISQPVLCSPTSVEPGEPSLGVNMVGIHIIEIARDGKTRAVKTWSFSDLLKDELSVIALDKATSTPLQHNIVAAMVAMAHKDESGKYTVGELAGATLSTDEEVEKALEPLKTVEALSGPFPGLYFNPQSERYSFHREWFQKHLVYPWPYDQYRELRRLSFGCLHVGYITTDYEYVRTRFAELILSLKVDVLELVGDIIAGRKHDLPERRQLVGDMNYDDQEQFAGELLASVLYDVFCKRFQAEISGMASSVNTPATCLSREQILECADKSFVTFAYIVGNHDTWVTAHGHTPAITFHLTLCSKLAHMLSLYLEDFNIPYRSVVDLLKRKILRLAEKKRVKDKEDSKASLAMYGYEMNGITVDMIHPYMPNAQTTSVRCEQVIRHSSANCVAVANFHKGVFVEVYHPEYGVQAASQAPCMLPFGTEFEDSKLKAVDFGPIFTVVRAHKGRIFYVEKMYFDDPIMTEPFDPFTNPRKLKRDLRIDPNPWLE